MNIGICCAAQDAAQAQEWGYTYVEPPLCLLAGADADALQSQRDALDAAGLEAYAFNRFFEAGKHFLLGDAAQVDTACEHARVTLQKAATLGGRIAVVGSGPARSRPADMPEAEALERFAAIAWRLGDIAAAAGLRIVIEPLSAADNNLLLTVAQALDFVRALRHPAVGALADWYHIGCNGEDLAALAHTDGLLWHAHVAHSTKRTYPAPDDGGDYTAFIQALQAGGYTGRLSVEASGDRAGAGDAYALLRSLA